MKFAFQYRDVFSLLLVVILLLSSCNGASESTTADTTSGAPSASVTTTLPASTTTAPITTFEPTPPTTEPETQPKTEDAPATEEVKKDCFEIFFDGLETVGKSITLDRVLTVEELSQVQTYLTAAEVRAVISAAWNKPYYRPQDISLYEILYADNTNTISTKEAILLTGDTLMTSEWSRMTADEIGNLMKKYTGIDITQSMLDDMVADQVDQDGKVVSQGAHYLSEYDAYYIQHTDAGGMYPINISGEWTADGKIVAHMQSAGPMDHVVVLLIPQEDSYWIEAVQWMDEHRVTDDPNVQ